MHRHEPFPVDTPETLAPDAAVDNTRRAPATEPVCSSAAVHGAGHRSSGLDVLRAAAIVAVVVLHVSGPSVEGLDGVPASWWWWANIFDSACRWCVPVFVMVSGALLLDPRRAENAGAFYRKRLNRIGVPLLFWCAFYLVWRAVYLRQRLSPLQILAALLTGAPYVHLYFLFVIAGLYVITPFLRMFVRRSSLSEQAAAAATAITLASAWSVVSAILHRTEPDTAIERFVPFIGYYLAGSVLSRWPRIHEIRRWSLPAACVATVVTAAGVRAGVAMDSVHFGVRLFYDYHAPAVVLMSVSIFVAGMAPSRTIETLGANAIVRALASASLGIYLIHPVFLSVMATHQLRDLRPHPLVAVPCWSAAILVASLLITLAVQRIPLIRRTVG